MQVVDGGDEETLVEQEQHIDGPVLYDFGAEGSVRAVLKAKGDSGKPPVSSGQARDV